MLPALEHSLDHDALNPGHHIIHLGHHQPAAEDCAQQRKRALAVGAVVRVPVSKQPGQQEPTT